MNKLLSEYNISIPNVKKKSNDAAAKALKGVSLCGRQAMEILTHFEEFLAMVITDPTKLSADHKRAMKAYLAFVDVWNVLVRVFDPTVPGARVEKANKVEALGKKFVTAFAKAASNKAVTVYMRLLYCEIPRIIKICPVDIHLASGMAGEQVLINFSL